MPVYEFHCPEGHEFEQRLPVDERNEPQTCSCGQPATRQMVSTIAWRFGRDGFLKGGRANLGVEGLGSIGRPKNALRFGPGATTGAKVQ